MAKIRFEGDVERDVTDAEQAKVDEICKRERRYRFELLKKRREQAEEMLAKVNAILNAEPSLKTEYARIIADCFDVGCIKRAERDHVEGMEILIARLQKFESMIAKVEPSVDDERGL